MKRETAVKFVLSIGMNDKDTHKQIRTKRFFVNRIKTEFANCSISERIGIYQGMIEKSLEVVYYGMSSEKSEVVRKIRNLKKALNQERIVLEVVKRAADFI